MIYATPETEHGERLVKLIQSDTELGIIALEHGEHVFYSSTDLAFTVDLLVCITNFLRTLNV
jgi:hypothetical protein